MRLACGLTGSGIGLLMGIVARDAGDGLEPFLIRALLGLISGALLGGACGLWLDRG